MNASETGKLLGLMALYDNRKVGPPDVVAWLKVVGDLPYADAETAVAEHYAETRERIMPADVRQRVKAMQAERLRQTPVPAPPPELLDDPAAYRAHLRESAARIADGVPPLRAITGDAS
jgi:hypothetical protein